MSFNDFENELLIKVQMVYQWLVLKSLSLHLNFFLFFIKIEWLPSYRQPNFGVLAKIVMSECDKSHIRER